MKRIRTNLILLAFSGCVLSTATATAYQEWMYDGHPVKWGTQNIDIYRSTVSFPPPYDQWMYNFTEMYDIGHLWNDQYGVNLWLTYYTTGITEWDPEDGMSTIGVTNLGQWVYGSTQIRPSENTYGGYYIIQEADVMLGGSYSYAHSSYWADGFTWDWVNSQTYDWPFDLATDEDLLYWASQPMPMAHVGAHEMGHFFGMAHQDHAPVILNTEPAGGGFQSMEGWLDQWFWDLTGDEMQFIRDTYPGYFSELPDYAASSYVWDDTEVPNNPNGNLCSFAGHTRPSPFPEPNDPNTECGVEMQPDVEPLSPLVVDAGDIIEDVRFVIWNKSGTAGTAPWDIVLSEDDAYDTNDYVCADGSNYLDGGEWQEVRMDVQACAMVDGTYHLIMRVNASEYQSEILYLNNEAVWNRKVTITNAFDPDACYCSEAPTGTTHVTSAVTMLGLLIAAVTVIVRRRI